MNTNELISKGALYFSNIQEGFDSCKHQILNLSVQEAYDYFLGLLSRKDCTNAYVDFYFFSLTKDQQETVLSHLSKEDCAFLLELGGQVLNNNEIIFPLSEPLLRIVTKLNDSAQLFSTIYFIDSQPTTYWGNYNHQYVLFH